MTPCLLFASLPINHIHAGWIPAEYPSQTPPSTEYIFCLSTSNFYTCQSSSQHYCQHINTPQRLTPCSLSAHGTEYAFGAHDFPTSGVFEVEPKNTPGFTFRQSIQMGTTQMTSQEFRGFIETAADEYTGDSYHLIVKNCNHFTEDMCFRMTGRHIPGWINRLAHIGEASDPMLLCHNRFSTSFLRI
jgi:hypothetical protein